MNNMQKEMAAAANRSSGQRMPKAPETDTNRFNNVHLTAFTILVISCDSCVF